MKDAKKEAKKEDSQNVMRNNLRDAWMVLQKAGLELSFIEFRSIWTRACAAGRKELKEMKAPIPADDAALYDLLVDLTKHAA